MSRWKWFASDASNKKGIDYREFKIRNKTTKKSVCFSYHHVTATSATQMIKYSSFLEWNVPLPVSSKPLDLLLDKSDLEATVKRSVLDIEFI